MIVLVVFVIVIVVVFSSSGSGDLCSSLPVVVRSRSDCHVGLVSWQQYWTQLKQ